MKKLHNLLVILPFFLILGWFTYQSMTLPDQEISEVENRELMQMPELEEDVEITSGAIQKYTGEITEYVVDQFPNRDEFLKFYSQLEMAQRKIFLRNVYLADSEWLMTHIYEVPNEQWGWLTSVIRQAKEKVDIPFVYAVLPQKNDLLHQIENGLIDNNNSFKNKAQLLEQLGTLEDVTPLMSVNICWRPLIWKNERTSTSKPTSTGIPMEPSWQPAISAHLWWNRGFWKRMQVWKISGGKIIASAICSRVT